MSDPYALESMLSARWEAIEQTLRPAEATYPAALVSVIFAGNVTHPWCAKATEFLSEHPTATAWRGELPDHYAFLYFPVQRSGFWYRFRESLEAIGPISPASMDKLDALIAKK